MRVFQGNRSLEICRRNEFQIVEFPDEPSARRWLADLRQDPLAVTRLRAMLAEDSPRFHLNRLGDEEVFAVLSRLLCRGELQAVVRRDALIGGPSAESPPEAVQAAPEKPVRTPPPGPEPEASTFEADHDAAAQADVLRAAAEEGVPFCEECAQAAGSGDRG